MKLEKLTKKEEKALEEIKKFIAKYGFAPSIRDLAQLINVNSSATAFFYLKKLENKKYLKRGTKQSRTIELLVPNEYLVKDNLEIPLIGLVHAGNLSEAIENPEDMISVPNYLINGKNEVFALHIKGDSMIDKGIFDRDIVIVEKKSVANNGDIVVALDNESNATIKTFYKEKDRFRLEPANQKMKPIYLKEVSILGQVIGLYRKI